MSQNEQTDAALTPPGLSVLATLRGHSERIGRIAWSPDGTRLGSPSDDDTIRVWDGKSATTTEKLECWVDRAKVVAWSGNGHALASASRFNIIRVWNPDTGRLTKTLKGHTDSVWDLSWSPTELRLASASEDRTVRVWDLSIGSSDVLMEHSRAVNCVSWSPSASILASGADDGNVIIWSTTTLQVSQVLGGHFGPVLSIEWSPNGRLLASAGQDRAIRIWDTESWRLLKVVEGHTAGIVDLSFSFDSAVLASASVDYTIKLWRCDRWEPVGSIESPRAYLAPPSVAFHPSLPSVGVVAADEFNIRIYNVDIDSLMSRESNVGSIHYANAKVVLVGEAGTGKTCLGRALMGQAFEPQESTHGMSVWHFRAEELQRPEGGRLLRETLLWDLAGQTDYQVVHQLFLDETALGIILFDSTHPENPFAGVGHWEKALRRTVGEACPRILVAGRVDRGHPTATGRDIERFRVQHGFDGFLETSAKTGRGVEELRAMIARAIRWDRLPTTTSPELWKDVREYLLRRRAGENILPRRSDLRLAYTAQQFATVIDPGAFDTVLCHAQAQGLVWRLSFGDFVLLQPELLNNYASAIVRAARKHPEGLGCVLEREVLEARIDFEDLPRIPEPSVERTLLHAVVELFLAREVALREADRLVFPSKFNRKRPEHPRLPPQDVRYRFSGPAEEIYATLVVRLLYSGAFDLKDLYQNVAEYLSPGGGTCGIALEASEGEGTISVFFSNAALDAKTLFLRFIQEHLRRRSIAGSISRAHQFRCPWCKEEIKDREAVELRARKGKQVIPCQHCDEQIPLKDLVDTSLTDHGLLAQVRTLEDRVEEKRDGEVGMTTARAKQEIGQYDALIVYNSADAEAVTSIAAQLKRRGLSPWVDAWDLPPGRLLQEELERILPTIGSVAIFVGPKGVEPWQDLVLRSAIGQFIKRRLPVIPVLLPTEKVFIPSDGSRSSRKIELPELPLFLQEFSWVHFVHRTDEAAALDRLQWGITGERPKGKFGA